MKTTRRHPLATIGLALALSGAVLAPAPARAQDPNAPVDGGGGETGEPLYGYLGTAVLAGLAAFILCKSSRRGA